MTTDLEFTGEANRFMDTLLDALDAIDPDDLDSQLSMGVLSMEFADGSKAILNRQTAAHQIWLAMSATAWHFEKNPDNGTWVDTKGRGELREILASELSKKLGQPVSL